MQRIGLVAAGAIETVQDIQDRFGAEIGEAARSTIGE